MYIYISNVICVCTYIYICSLTWLPVMGVSIVMGVPLNNPFQLNDPFLWESSEIPIPGPYGICIVDIYIWIIYVNSHHIPVMIALDSKKSSNAGDFTICFPYKVPLKAFGPLIILDIPRWSGAPRYHKWSWATPPWHRGCGNHAIS